MANNADFDEEAAIGNFWTDAIYPRDFKDGSGKYLNIVTEDGNTTVEYHPPHPLRNRIKLTVTFLRARGEIKEVAAPILLISSLHLAALQRSGKRTPFHVYVDEFHNFHGFNEMVSGIRKFGISVTLCHQYISQLAPDLRDAMLGTIGTIISFQIEGMTQNGSQRPFTSKPTSSPRSSLTRPT